jgi:predicted DNA-binding mobile mystery protein A
MYTFMKARKQRLILEHVSRKLESFGPLAAQQPSGWINTIRTALNMSLSQLGKRANKTAQGARALEQREKSGAITLQSLREIAEAMDMKLVYAIVPKAGTLEEMVNEKVALKAQEIVNRTSTSMALEDQENAKARLLGAFAEKKMELKNEMPKFLWD